MKKTVAEVFGLAIPAPFKSKQRADKTLNDDLMVGLELEVENLGRGHDYYVQQAGSFWSVVEDGSLRPRGMAWEFISRPALLGVTLAELRILLEKLGFNAGNYSDRCSVHVHTNILDFTQQQVANLALVYPVVEPVLFEFVNHHNAPDKYGYSRDTNLYCIPWAGCRMNRNFIDKFFNNPEEYADRRERLGGGARWEKYTALNFQPMARQGTVEWRHMHGTADLEKLTTWLNTIGSIMKFCKEEEFDKIRQHIMVLNDVSTYQQFFTKVLGPTLAYREEYRPLMAEGVINAKYSLMNWEANKGKERPTKKAKSLYDQFVEQRQQFVVEDNNNVDLALDPDGWGDGNGVQAQAPQLAPEPARFARFNRREAAPQAAAAPDPFAGIVPPDPWVQRAVQREARWIREAAEMNAAAQADAAERLRAQLQAQADAVLATRQRTRTQINPAAGVARPGDVPRDQRGVRIPPIPPRGPRTGRF